MYASFGFLTSPSMALIISLSTFDLLRTAGLSLTTGTVLAADPYAPPELCFRALYSFVTASMYRSA